MTTPLVSSEYIFTAETHRVMISLYFFCKFQYPKLPKYPWSNIILTCPLPVQSEDANTIHVRLLRTTLLNRPPMDWIPVEFPEEPESLGLPQPSPRVAVALSPIRCDDGKFAKRMVEWMEMQKAAGFAKVSTYVKSFTGYATSEKLCEDLRGI